MGTEPSIVVTTVIDATPAQVWADVSDLTTHVTWMQDAEEIRFTSERRSGAGTTFECDTRVGPLRTTDVMEVTAWDAERRIGVRHVGLVEGTGEFTLRALGPRHTEFRWAEELRFPWFMGGRLGASLARPVLRAIWRRNLDRLMVRLEAIYPRSD